VPRKNDSATGAALCLPNFKLPKKPNAVPVVNNAGHGSALQICMVRINRTPATDPQSSIGKIAVFNGFIAP
jgi:hypothetical protein